MAFEVFQAAGARNKSFISVTDNKTFGLSRAFIDKHHITKNHKAVILYDADTGRVALHFSTNNPKFGYSIQQSNEKHGAIIAARGFFDLKSIDAKKYARRYDDYEKLSLKSLGVEKDGDAFVLTLKEKVASTDPDRFYQGNDIVIEDIGEEPINLDDIPF
jgi:hypothetical protein